MKTLYLECGMGAAGDMLTAALLELVPDREQMLGKLSAAMPEGVRISAQTVQKQGITGTQMTVLVNGEEEHSEDVHTVSGHDGAHHHHHSHCTLHEIEAMIAEAPVSAAVRKQAAEIYRLIAEAEGAVHGKPAAEIHFHEVGTKDAVADVLSVCMLMEELKPEQVIVSPVHTGFGHVHCAHGILPVPAPAAALLLRGIPVCAGDLEGELCTPTGAALLKYFGSSFGNMPVMQTEKIGYGFGKKEFPRLNCLRAFFGETAESGERILELCCNLDDITGEAVGFAQEILLQSGALDVFTAPVYMKKNRPGILLTCLCREEQREEMLSLIFRYTSTAGIRERICSRYALERSEKSLPTSAGTVRVKYVSGFGTERKKPEYEDLKRIACEQKTGIDAVRASVEKEI